MRSSDWSSDVCSSYLPPFGQQLFQPLLFVQLPGRLFPLPLVPCVLSPARCPDLFQARARALAFARREEWAAVEEVGALARVAAWALVPVLAVARVQVLVEWWLRPVFRVRRSEEHTYELQSLMRISYAVFCLKKKRQS